MTYHQYRAKLALLDKRLIHVLFRIKRSKKYRLLDKLLGRSDRISHQYYKGLKDKTDPLV